MESITVSQNFNHISQYTIYFYSCSELRPTIYQRTTNKKWKKNGTMIILELRVHLENWGNRWFKNRISCKIDICMQAASSINIYVFSQLDMREDWNICIMNFHVSYNFIRTSSSMFWALTSRCICYFLFLLLNVWSGYQRALGARKMGKRLRIQVHTHRHTNQLLFTNWKAGPCYLYLYCSI